MRPTGKLHLGNYMGALYNWVKLQHQYECYFFIADYHALTTDYADPSQVKQNSFDVVLDFLSAGLDPARCTIFVQSHVPQHAELHLLLSMITPVSWLERVPTYKDQQEQLREKDLATYGFLGYPVLMASDILVYQPNFVPVGQDQTAHVELTRELARRFNSFYSPKRVAPGGSGDAIVMEPDPAQLILPEPEVLYTPSPKLPGTDGRKMSKSYGNSILLSAQPVEVAQKMQSMTNGGQRLRAQDPGDPDICPVGDMHRVFSSESTLEQVSSGCRAASIRCDECKKLAADAINAHLEPIRQRRAELEKNPDAVWNILDEGAERAAKRAEQTMVAVRAVTGLSRDRSGVRHEQAALQETDGLRNLSEFRAWWDAEPRVMIQNLRDEWRRNIVPVDAALKPDADGVWITQNKRRVFVAAASELVEREVWEFSVKPKSYEVLVLLCWDRDFIVHDFVVPQKLYVEAWTKAKKAAKNGNIEFNVTLAEGRYVLQLPDSTPIDITDAKADYQIIN